MTPASLLAECQKAGVIVELTSGAIKLIGQPEAVQNAADRLRPFKSDLVRYLGDAADDAHQPSSVPPEHDALTSGRLALFVSRGVYRAAAMALADRLAVRDQQLDDRRVCLECLHMAGTANARRCGQWRLTLMKGLAMPADLVDVLQRCPGFTGAPGVTPK